MDASDLQNAVSQEAINSHHEKVHHKNNQLFGVQDCQYVAVFAPDDTAFADIANAVEGGNMQKLKRIPRLFETFEYSLIVMEIGSATHLLSQLFWIVNFI